MVQQREKKLPYISDINIRKLQEVLARYNSIRG